MNNDIATMRAAIAGITALITQRGLIVTQQGIEAYVRKDPKTHQPVLVNIPYLPDNASQQLVLAIQGFIDHECGHVLETDYTVWAEVERWAADMAAKGIPGTFAMWNITEDTFIERKMCERFKGTAYNLERLQEFFVAELTGPVLEKAVKAGDHARIFSVLLVPMARAWSGQDVFVRFMADKWHLVAKEVAKIGSLKDRFPTLATSREAFALARDLVTALYVAPPKAAAPKPKPPASLKPAEKPAPEPKVKDEPKEEPKPSETKKDENKPEPKDEPEKADKPEPPAPANANEPEDDEDEDDLDTLADDVDAADESDEAGDAGAGDEPADEGDEGEAGGGDEDGDESAGGAGADEPLGFDKKGERDPLQKAHRKILAARYDRKMTFEEIATASRLPVSKIVSLHDQALTVIETNAKAA